MKMTLSTPRTISRKVSVTRASKPSEVRNASINARGAGISSPEVLDTEHEGIRGVRPVDVPHDQRAGLDDAVDHAGIERVVVDVQRLVEIRERAREVLRDSVARVDVQLLQLVEHLRQLIGRRNRAAGRNRVEVIA